MINSLLRNINKPKSTLSYLELLSPNALCIPQIGSIISPKLKDIAYIGLGIYRHYLSMLSMDTQTYMAMLGQEPVQGLPMDADSAGINLFTLLTSDVNTTALLQEILNFFIQEEVIYSLDNKCFFTQENNELIGVINSENYPLVCSLICQRNYLKSNQPDDTSNVKSKKALEIMEKIRKGRREKAKHATGDANMELANIISAVANKSPALNMVNIWELTIYQLWDCFYRLFNNSIYDIQSMSVAAWGNKEGAFDNDLWYRKMQSSDNFFN